MKTKLLSFSLFWLFALALLPASTQAQELDDIPVRLAFRRAAELLRFPTHNLRLLLPQFKDMKQVYQPYGKHPRQYFIVCEPSEGSIHKEKSIFFIHGGGWHVGRAEQHLSLAKKLTDLGYRVFLPGYRLCPKHSGEEMREDIYKAFEKANAYMQSMDIDKPEWIIGGASAGGNLAGILVYDNFALEKRGLSQEQIRGFFSLSAPLDLEVLPDAKPLYRYAGQRDALSFAESSPLCHVQGDENIPVLLLHGTKDALVNYQSVLSFWNGICQHNPELVELYLMTNATHIALTSKWYYKKKENIGQMDYIRAWLEKLERAN